MEKGVRGPRSHSANHVKKIFNTPYPCHMFTALFIKTDSGLIYRYLRWWCSRGRGGGGGGEGLLCIFNCLFLRAQRQKRSSPQHTEQYSLYRCSKTLEVCCLLTSFMRRSGRGCSLMMLLVLMAFAWAVTMLQASHVLKLLSFHFYPA